MSVPGTTLSRTNWREYAYAVDAISRRRANAAFSHSPALAIFAAETLVDEPGGVPMSGIGRTVQTGGPAILKFVVLGKHAGAQMVSGGFGTHSLAPDDNERPTEVNWKFANQALVVSEHDLEVNRGETQIASFLDRQTTQVMTSLADLVADQLYAVTPGPNDIASFRTLISANDSVQGLDGATFTNWNSRGLSAVGTTPASVSFASGSFAAQGLADMRRLVNNAEEGMVRPNVILTEYDTIERYEASLQPQERFAGPVRVADGSFPSLAFRTIPVIPDRKCGTGDMYALRVGDEAYGVQLIFLSGAAFQFSEWKPSPNQTAMVKPLRATCNLAIGNRSFGNNRMSSITD